MNLKQIELFINYPHLFGHYLGYTDLIDLHSKWIIDAWIKKDVKAMQAHRNSFKTTSILIIGAIWYLLFIDPNVNILFIRKSSELCEKVLKSIRQHFESSEILYITQNLYKTKSLRTENWSTKSLSISLRRKITPEGNIDSIGMGGAITGAHYDYIFPDDIITIEDRISKAEREKTKEYIRELRNIKKFKGKIFFSGTPWHKEDGWQIIPEPVKYPVGTIPIRGYTEKELEKTISEIRSGTTSSLYAANYELKHIADENRLFPDPKYAEWDNITKVIGAIDPAYSGEHHTALVMIGKNKNNEWVCRGWTWRKNIIDLYNDIINLCLQYNCGSLHIESNADKGYSLKDLSKLWPSIHGYHEKQNKHTKIISFGVQHFTKILFANDCQREFLNQILDYQEGLEPDDAPDIFSSLLRILGFSGHKLITTSKISANSLGI